MGDETISSDGASDTKEAEALAAALNHSAERVQTLWFSFLTFMLYLAIATGTTTHRMLFLESPLNLPVLNIPLPLLAFYILTPIIFVVFHFYMLLNLVLLARTAKSFEDALGRARLDGEARENFRMRIENTLFVQLLVGGRLEREGFNATLLSLMALITLALAPVALMLFLEVKFLPYHSEGITWLHRGLLALGLALVWTLWPGYRSQGGERLWPQRSWRLVPAGVLSAAALTYAVVVATFPDERMYASTYWLHGSTYLDPWSGETSSPNRPNLYPLIAPVNTLALRGEDLIDDAKLAHILEKNESSTDARWVATWSLANRDLTGADLWGCAAPGRLAQLRAAPGRLALRCAAAGRLVSRSVCLESGRSRGGLEGHKGSRAGDETEGRRRAMARGRLRCGGSALRAAWIGCSIKGPRFFW
jgi:hypothetical protein